MSPTLNATALVAALLAGIVGAAETTAIGHTGSYAYVLIDNREDADSETVLAGIRAGLSSEASDRLAGQGHFDASPRLMVKFRGTCAADTSFVDEIKRAVAAVNASGVSCQSELPGG